MNREHDNLVARSDNETHKHMGYLKVGAST